MKSYIVGFLALLSQTNQVNAGFVDDCTLQSKCVEFTTSPVPNTADTCGSSVGYEVAVSPCLVQVCMHVDTSKAECAKATGDPNNPETISHVCDASDKDGCPSSGKDSNQKLTFDTDAHGTCDGATLGTGGQLFGKCEGVSDTTFCQLVPAGSPAYFIVKDGKNDEDADADAKAYNGLLKSGTGSVECFKGTGATADITQPLIIANNSTYDQKFSCGGGPNLEKTSRVWSVTTDVISVCPGPSDDEPEDEQPPTSPAPTPTDPPTAGEPEDEGTPAPVPTPTKTVGDPHFLTWKKEHFEFHGQCDITLAKDDDFADGLGLNVQIRTQVVRHWSYNRNIAVMIGDDILEVEGGADSATWWFNLERLGKLTKIGDGKFPLTHHVQSPFKQSFEIDLSSKYPGHKIVVSTYKEFVRVDFQGDSEAAYGKTIGILGDYKTGKTLARDGSTVLDDFMELGEEWQVLPSENMLFHKAAAPQFPEKCIRPDDPRGERRRRRLGEVSVTEDQAEAACAHLKDALDRKDCVYDVLATQDVGMVGAY